MRNMKIIYLGTPEFAVKPLKAIVAAGHQVLAVITNPDRKIGRKQLLSAPPIKSAALSMGLEVLQYEKVSKEGVEKITELNPDIMVTCAFGQILSEKLIEIPKFGVINVHASLLPKYRGASPVQWAVANGEKETGVTIMNTVKALDAGDIILQEKINIERETADEMFEKLSEFACPLLIRALTLIESGKAEYLKQDENKATKCSILTRETGLIDWSKSAERIDSFIRGMNSWPVAYTFLNGIPLKIWDAAPSKESGNAGEVVVADVKSGFIVACGENSLFIKQLQLSGGKKMSWKDFIAGRKICKGDLLG